MTTSKKPYPSWKEVSSGKWEQLYGFQDAFYGIFVGKAGERPLFLLASSMKIVFVGKDSNENLARRLREAWIQMRYMYPILAAVSLDKTRVYESPQNLAEVDTWANETFRIHEDITLTDIWDNMVKTLRPTLHFLPNTGELLLQSEHTHMDGRGFLHFWNEFFNLLVNPKPMTLGQDVGNLPGRADDYVNTQDRSPGRGHQLANHMLESLEVSPPETPINYPVTKTDPTQKPLGFINSRSVLKLSPDETGKINSACKARNLSLAAVWHAALVYATQEAQRDAGVQPGTTYVTFGNFDLRRYFQPDIREKSEGRATIGNFHTVLPYVTRPNGRPFLDVAKDLSSFYRLGLQEQPDIWSALRPMMSAIGEDYIQGPPPDTTPAVSSLGVIDHYIKNKYEGPAGECSILDAWFGDTCTGPWLECFIWIMGGSLTLSSCFNGTCYSVEEIDVLHRKVRAHMIRGLGLEDIAGSAKL